MLAISKYFGGFERFLSILARFQRFWSNFKQKLKVALEKVASSGSGIFTTV